MSDVAAETCAGWATVHRMPLATAVTLGAPALARILRIDETRSRSLRRLLLGAGEQLSAKALARLTAALGSDDPTGEVSAAWAVKELLRQLLQAHGSTR